MAIDTAEKRLSVLGMDRVPKSLFIPDGSAAQTSGQRVFLTGMYAGLDFETGGEGVRIPPDGLTLDDMIRYVTEQDDLMEGLREWYFANMPSPPSDIDDYSVQDLEHMFLSQQTGARGSLQDLWMRYLSAYSGTIQDRQAQFWKNGGVI